MNYIVCSFNIVVVVNVNPAQRVVRFQQIKSRRLGKENQLV